ncbi:MAG: hypothetical protein H0U76_01890 [Ktedonobacteraceae bacterium]|nr:hypothetical protein [Ktedonobacteraceae bacterium]
MISITAVLVYVLLLAWRILPGRQPTFSPRPRQPCAHCDVPTQHVCQCGAAACGTCCLDEQAMLCPMCYRAQLAWQSRGVAAMRRSTALWEWSIIGVNLAEETPERKLVLLDPYATDEWTIEEVLS